MSFTVILFHEQKPLNQKYQFDTPGIYTIGRGKDCSLTIPKKLENSLSRQHCQVILKDLEVFIRDAGSSNGTHVNGKELPDGTANLDSNKFNNTDCFIHDGDTIMLGNSVFQIKIVDNDDNNEDIPQLTTTENGTVLLPAVR